MKNREQPSMVIREVDPNQVTELLSRCGPGTKAYFGADSSRFKIDGVWYADYMVVLVIHINGKNGCKIFGETTRELDFDRSRADRPFNRMMTETAKVIEFYNKLKPYIEPYILSIPDFDMAIHLDINPNNQYGSSCAVSSAVGLVKATCNIEPMIKPLAPMASYAADRYKEVAHNQLFNKSQIINLVPRGTKVKQKKSRQARAV